jgi:hypothetical protein
MSPVHVQFPKMMVCMLQIINLDNVQVCYTHPGEGRRGRDGMVVGDIHYYTGSFDMIKTRFYIR